MGNCIALCRPKQRSLQAPRAVAKNERVLRIVKPLQAADYYCSHSMAMDGASISAKTIKVIITKKELQDLVSKKMSVEELLMRIQRSEAAGINGDHNSVTRWMPVLETIPE